jgi:hypothetical protein
MAVTEADVLALRAEGNAQPLNWDAHPFPRPETCAEILGHLIYELRTIGQTEPDLLDDVEVFTRAIAFNSTELRAARSTLRLLGFSSGITKRLTAVARRAPPPPPTWTERMQAASAASEKTLLLTP